MSLTVKKVAKLLRRGEPGRHLDSGPLPAQRGLYLIIANKTAAHWELRFQIDKRARQMGLGSARTFTLAQARERAKLHREKLADKIDPLEARRAERAAQKAAAVKVMTFAEAAHQFLKQRESEKAWRSRSHAHQWITSLSTYALPTLGPISVAAVDTSMVLRVIEPIWAAKTETASRLRGRIEAILGWATVRGYRSGDNPAQWRNHLDTRDAAIPINDQRPLAQKLHNHRQKMQTLYDDIKDETENAWRAK